MLGTPLPLPPLQTCPQCQHRHYALVCHICGLPTPVWVALLTRKAA